MCVYNIQEEDGSAGVVPMDGVVGDYYGVCGSDQCCKKSSFWSLHQGDPDARVVA